MTKFSSVLDMYAPLKKVLKQILKFRNKPRIDLGLQKSIFIENCFLYYMHKIKRCDFQTEAQIKYNQHRNLFSTLMKVSKRSYFSISKIT